MLPSQRIAAAPTLEFPDHARSAWRYTSCGYTARAPYGDARVPNFASTPVNDLQLSMIAAVESIRQQRELQPIEIEHLRQRVPTVAHIGLYFKEAGLTNQ